MRAGLPSHSGLRAEAPQRQSAICGRAGNGTASQLKAAEDTGPENSSENPLHELAAELADFHHGVSRPGRLSLVGTMLQESTAADLRARYQARIIAPRRRRIRTILERAQQRGLIDSDADLEIAVTLPTGSWYAQALAGSPPPPNWPKRTANLLWRAVGGSIPIDQPPNTADANPHAAEPQTAKAATRFTHNPDHEQAYAGTTRRAPAQRESTLTTSRR